MILETIDKLKGSLKSKLSTLGVLLFIAGMADQLTPFITQLVPDQFKGLAVSLLGIVIWGLRWYTTQPLEQK